MRPRNKTNSARCRRAGKAASTARARRPARHEQTGDGCRPASAALRAPDYVEEPVEGSLEHSNLLEVGAARRQLQVDRENTPGRAAPSGCKTLSTEQMPCRTTQRRLPRFSTPATSRPTAASPAQTQAQRTHLRQQQERLVAQHLLLPQQVHDAGHAQGRTQDGLGGGERGQVTRGKRRVRRQAGKATAVGCYVCGRRPRR